jgi:hypothetical protein
MSDPGGQHVIDLVSARPEQSRKRAKLSSNVIDLIDTGEAYTQDRSA